MNYVPKKSGKITVADGLDKYEDCIAGWCSDVYSRVDDTQYKDFEFTNNTVADEQSYVEQEMQIEDEPVVVVIIDEESELVTIASSQESQKSDDNVNSDEVLHDTVIEDAAIMTQRSNKRVRRENTMIDEPRSVFEHRWS